MLKNILSLLLLSALIGLQGCELLENPAPREKPKVITSSDYSFVPDAKKEILINESFSNNGRNWPTLFSNTLSYLAISYGELNMLSDFSGETLATIDVSTFTGNTNFEIEVLLEAKSNMYDNGNKIIWGYDASTKQHNFLKINNYNMQLSTGRFDGSKDVEKIINYWSGPFYKNGYNKYTIRKINNQYYYFVNETLLHQEPFTDFKGYRIGFQTGRYNEIYVDYLTVKKLNL